VDADDEYGFDDHADIGADKWEALDQEIRESGHKWLKCMIYWFCSFYSIQKYRPIDVFLIGLPTPDLLPNHPLLNRLRAAAKHSQKSMFSLAPCT
jgi:hypothetical protein